MTAGIRMTKSREQEKRMEQIARHATSLLALPGPRED
jgi:hypothetical protein